ncbi:MAG: N-acetyltransferase [Dehalococcoidia bacterium]|nr:N-acetyltransferase [Dehalococcoidia bacterium]
MKVEKAKITDVPRIHKLVNHFATKDRMLARPLSELYEDVRDFFVVRQGDVVAGCGAAHVNWADLVEIKALAVDEKHQHKGIGAAIVEACIAEARQMDVPNVFCLTYETVFFGKFGFEKVGLMELPRKVWGECQRCPKYPDCDETAMILKLR